MRARMLNEADDHFVMHDGASEFRVPKKGLSEALHEKIRAMGNKMFMGGNPVEPEQVGGEIAAAPLPPPPPQVDFSDAESEPITAQPVTQVHGVLREPPVPPPTQQEQQKQTATDVGLAFKGEQRAEQDKANIQKDLARQDAELAAEKVRLAEAQAIDTREKLARSQSARAEHMAKVQGARDEMSRIDTSIDPGRWWASRSTEQKVLGYIGLALGSLSPDGVNRAAQQMDKAIERDIDAQKSEHEFRLRKGQSSVDSATSMYAMNHQFSQDDIAATAGAHASAWSIIENKAQAAKTSTMGPLAQANADGLIALSGQKKAEYDAMQANRVGELSVKQQNANTEAYKAMTERGAKVGPGGKDLPATSLAELGDFDVAKKQLIELRDAFNKYDEGGAWAKAGNRATRWLGLTDTDASKFNATKARVQQTVGKILEGGKLAQGDEAKYAALVLEPGDNPAVVKEKTEGMISFLDDIRDGKIKVYREGGFKTPTSTGNSQAQPASRDGKEAVDWAHAHPKDPRASAILRLNGV